MWVLTLQDNKSKLHHSTKVKNDVELCEFLGNLDTANYVIRDIYFLDTDYDVDGKDNMKFLKTKKSVEKGV